MTTASPTPRRGLEAFASRDFRRYQLARVAVILGAEAQSVAVAWQVYSITHRAIDLGTRGSRSSCRRCIFLLPGGHVADRFDRRRVILTCYSLQCLHRALVLLARNNTQNILAIYSVLFFVGTGRAFSGPGELRADSASCAGRALCQRGHLGRSRLSVCQHHRAGAGRAACSRFRLRTLCRVRGWRARALCTCSRWERWCWFLVLVSSMHVRPGRMEHRDFSLKVLLAGFQYVRRSQLLLGSFSLDLFVVLLGGATALMPIFAHDILHQGPRGLGMLRAAPALGAVVMALVMARFPLRTARGAHGCLFACRSSASPRWFSACRALCGCRWPRCSWRARQIPSA